MVVEGEDGGGASNLGEECSCGCRAVVLGQPARHEADAVGDSRQATARRELLAKVAERGLAISALTCSGNPLHPGPSGREHDQVARRTIALAPLLGIDRVMMMSGLPGGPGDANPHWFTVSWPPETTQILEWQWTEVPYWRDLVAHSRDRGVPKLALEMHAHQAVYNVPTLLRLREEGGPVVGANFDPSHRMWMGAAWFLPRPAPSRLRRPS
ncbi:sugar phosphate isomerase/epimerase family protein [Streptomyces sp. NPDC002817]